MAKVTNQTTPLCEVQHVHAGMKRNRRNTPFLVENMFYNKDLDFYVCPMGQHLEFIGTKKETSDLGYVSTRS